MNSITRSRHAVLIFLIKGFIPHDVPPPLPFLFLNIFFFKKEKKNEQTPTDVVDHHKPRSSTKALLLTWQLRVVFQNDWFDTHTHTHYLASAWVGVGNVSRPFAIIHHRPIYYVCTSRECFRRRRKTKHTWLSVLGRTSPYKVKRTVELIWRRGERKQKWPLSSISWAIHGLTWRQKNQHDSRKKKGKQLNELSQRKKKS